MKLMLDKENPNTFHSIKQELFYVALIAISVCSVLFQYFGMEKSFKFTEYNAKQVQISSDSVNDGKSIGTFEVLNNKIVLQCQTKNTSYTFAYCGINIGFNTDENKTIDLHGYDSIEFTLDYNASVKDTLLVYLSNLEYKHSKKITRNNMHFPGAVLSTDKPETIVRANMHAYLPKEGHQKVKLKLNDFTVPSWWLLLQNTVDESVLTNFDNVTQLRIVSGDSTQERSVNFTVSDIVFKGKWIQADSLYLLLLTIWLLVIGYNSLFSFNSIRIAYTSKEKESKTLKNLNKLLAKERNKYENMAKTDALTHCYNREGLNEIIQNEIDFSIKQGKPCSIILLDIDHFKIVNDKFGHNEGDLVLVNLANLIHENIKAKDTLARWGGEEFIVVCSNTSLNNALLVAESLRKLIESTVLSKKIKITSSFGVAQLDLDGFDSNFKRADEALYKAKSLGRNNVQSN